MFEEELYLAYAVINRIQVRGEGGNYNTKRVKFYFNYTP
jgi:putative transposase